MAENNKELLKIEEVSVLIGVSYKTIQNWYAWKRQNPEHELAKLLPDVIQHGARGRRFWDRKDVGRLIEFKLRRPIGQHGVMGSVTRKYYHKENEK